MSEFIVKILNQLGYQVVSTNQNEFCIARKSDGRALEFSEGYARYKSSLMKQDEKFFYCFTDRRHGIEIDMSRGLNFLKIKFGNCLVIDTDGNKIFSLYPNQEELTKYNGDVISIGDFGHDVGENTVDMYVYRFQDAIGIIQLLDTRYSFNGTIHELDSYQAEDIADVYMKLIGLTVSKYRRSDQYFEKGYELISPFIRESILNRIFDWQKSLEGHVSLWNGKKESVQESIDRARKSIEKAQKSISDYEKEALAYEDKVGRFQRLIQARDEKSRDSK